MAINLATWKFEGGSTLRRFIHKDGWNVPKNDRASENGRVGDLMPCLDIVHKLPSILCAKKAWGGKCGDCHQRGLTGVVYQSVNTEK